MDPLAKKYRLHSSLNTEILYMNPADGSPAHKYLNPNQFSLALELSMEDLGNCDRCKRPLIEVTRQPLQPGSVLGRI
jgi:hypothetical protein